MVQVNLDGNSPSDIPRAYVAQDVYEAKIVRVSDPFMAKSNYGDDKEKVVVDFEIKSQDVTIPMYMTTVVSKGSGDYSNSKMYDLLDSAKLLEKFSEMWKSKDFKNDVERTATFIEFLKNNLMDQTCKVISKTVNKDDADKKYSVVDKILKFE